MDFTEEEQEFVNSLNLLTSKPVIYAANVSEDDLADEGANNEYVARVREFAASENAEVVVVCAQIEAEISELESDEEKKEFYATVLPLMKENFHRVYEDVAWFIEKYDYKNKDADWKDSKDAIQRGMQKLRGSDPSLPPHVLKK